MKYGFQLNNLCDTVLSKSGRYFLVWNHNRIFTKLFMIFGAVSTRDDNKVLHNNQYQRNSKSDRIRTEIL